MVFGAVVIRHINGQENVNIAVFCAGGAQFEGTSGSLYILQPNPESWSRSFHEGYQGSWCIRYVGPNTTPTFLMHLRIQEYVNTGV
jgi:hypothetical protein